MWIDVPFQTVGDGVWAKVMIALNWLTVETTADLALTNSPTIVIESFANRNVVSFVLAMVFVVCALKLFLRQI